MKIKKFMIALAILAVSSLSFQSCIGSFSLTNKVLSWNKNVGNKFVNELVFFAFWLLPVYEVTSVADLLVINSIEFWSGNSPMQANHRVIETEQGNYEILAHASGYDVTSPDGSSMNFRFDSETQTWSFSKNGNDAIDFMRFTDPGHVQMLDADGEFVDVELTEQGVKEYLAGASMPMMAALK